MLSLGAGTIRADLVTNGGFETGDTTGWTLTNSVVFDSVCLNGSAVGAATCIVHTGDFAMSFGNSTGVTSFTQTLATTPGQTYTLSFWLANDNPGNQNTTTFEALWDGASIFLLGSPQPTFPYGQQTFNVTATGSSTVLEFRAEQDPSQWFLDDVMVTPEPGSALLIGTALTAFGLGSLRRKRNAR